MSHRRQKRIRKLAKWTHQAAAAQNKADVDLFVDTLMGMGAADSEIRRAVKVLINSGQVRHVAAKAVVQDKAQAQVDGVANALPLQPPREGLRDMPQDLATEATSNRLGES